MNAKELFASTLLASSLLSAHPSQAGAPTALAPGLKYREIQCAAPEPSTGPGALSTIDLQELELSPGHSLELRAIPNPSAHPNRDCSDGYGGQDLGKILQKPTPDFDILAATNGTVFRESAHGYASNSLLWSKGPGLIAPLRRRGGNELFIADEKGGHAFKLEFVRCEGAEACAKIGKNARSQSSSQLLQTLRTQHPTMTLAIQSNMPLMEGRLDALKKFQHWSRCPANNSSDWRCRELPRTLLCAKKNGVISLLTTPRALPFELAERLRPGGGCALGCLQLYNLDGGRSTQMAKAPEDPTPGKTYLLSGHRIETNQPDCSPYRPVQNYLVIGKPRKPN